MIRVISADDHAVVRGGVRQMLAQASDIQVVGEASDGAALMQLLQLQACDVLLLDISMPGKDGLAVLHDVRDKWPSIAVVILTMHPENQYATRALRLGAQGYLTKASIPEQLVKAVRTVAAGRRYVTEALEQMLADRLAGEQGNASYETLSDREYKVLVRIGAGQSVSAIAEELFLSVNTVKTYRARLLTKLGLASTGELIRYTINHHLIA
jgi:DNA-binding NarL/FixJ family response regulator